MQGHFDEVSNRYVAFWTQLFCYSGKTVEEKTSLLELQFRPGQKGVLPLMKEIRTRGLFLLAEETALVLLFMQESCILPLERKRKAYQALID